MVFTIPHTGSGTCGAAVHWFLGQSRWTHKEYSTPGVQISVSLVPKHERNRGRKVISWIPPVVNRNGTTSFPPNITFYLPFFKLKVTFCFKYIHPKVHQHRIHYFYRLLRQKYVHSYTCSVDTHSCGCQVFREHRELVCWALPDRLLALPTKASWGKKNEFQCVFPDHHREISKETV